ncbi:cheR methyltransferase, SAM binding domain [Geobacter sp. OR-1]|uniref:CheR family methyltransferase n=1 Tax=Geobacter sp. OR-1 TaxID=1266765 RepID=UPI000542528F|nr:CheR family methyltransferase [Geobacter sp. OR-1]GAM09253.1 cheR methyltransferase, SAM binding domain [Geobacter sp. OR-1]
MRELHLNLQATQNSAQFENNFNRLFVQGRIVDSDLERRIIRLGKLFATFVSSCRAPCWDEHLVVTNEISRITETYLEFSVIRQALLRLVKLSIRGTVDPPPILFKSNGWLEFLDMFRARNKNVNPALLVDSLTRNQAERISFLFSLFLPEQFGGSFGRYPGQMHFLDSWVRSQDYSCRPNITCLDAACGSGEGSYELAALLQKCGVEASRISISGVTISPLEVFAAAHAYFPHDSQREAQYRRYIRSIAQSGSWARINFMTGDLKSWEPCEKYQIIICNGIIGGPLLHDNKDIEEVLGRLVTSMHNGGILLAADRFHDGWKRKFPAQELEGLLRKYGLEIMPISEGVAGVSR